MSFILDFVFPRVCHYCHLPIEGKGKIFCADCASQIELISLKGRCASCFNVRKDKICSFCQKAPSSFHNKGALFEPLGVNQRFLELYMHNSSHLIDQLLAAYVLVQIQKLKWDWPNLILYTNPSLLKRVLGARSRDRGLAKELAKLLGARASAGFKSIPNLHNQNVLVLNPKEEVAIFPKRLYGLFLSASIFES